MGLPFADITGQVIGALYEVHSELGPGYAEIVYRNALVIALRDRGVKVECEKPLAICFRDQCVGEYRVDMICAGTVLVEIKAGASLHPHAFAQTLNYLKGTGLPVGLILYFGRKPSFERLVNRAPSG